MKRYSRIMEYEIRTSKDIESIVRNQKKKYLNAKLIKYFNKLKENQVNEIIEKIEKQLEKFKTTKL